MFLPVRLGLIFGFEFWFLCYYYYITINYHVFNRYSFKRYFTQLN